MLKDREEAKKERIYITGSRAFKTCIRRVVKNLSQCPVRIWNLSDGEQNKLLVDS